MAWQKKCLTCEAAGKDAAMNTNQTAWRHKRKGHQVVWLNLDNGQVYNERPKSDGFKPQPVSQQGMSYGKVSPIMFRMGQDVVEIQPGDLFRIYEQFVDMKEQYGWGSDFSSTVREGMKMLRAIVGASQKGGR